MKWLAPGEHFMLFQRKNLWRSWQCVLGPVLLGADDHSCQLAPGSLPSSVSPEGGGQDAFAGLLSLPPEHSPLPPPWVCFCATPSFLLSLYSSLSYFLGFPGGANVKEPACQCRRQKRHRFNRWVRKVPWRRAWPPAPVFLPGKSHGQRSLMGCSPEGPTESDATEAT